MMDILEKNAVDGVISRKKQWIEPLYAFYSKDMSDNFLKSIESNNLKLFDIIKQHNMYYVEETVVESFSEGLDIFNNLNYSEDLGILKEIFGEEADISEQ